MAAGLSRALGLGFIFGAKDEGAIRMTEDIGDGMDKMARTVREVGEESVGIQRLGNFIGALNLSQLNRVGSALEGLAERAGALSGEISSTSLESHGAQFAQEYRAATAGLGEYRAEVDLVRGQISGLAFDLGVGASDMVSYAVTVAKTGRKIDDFGLSMREVAGSIQAGILTGEQLGNVLTGLAEGYDLGARGAKRVLDTVTALGEQFGSGAETARSMPEILQAVDQAAARFPQISDNVEVAIESITRLGLAQQRRLGGTFQEGVQGAINVFNELAGTRREMEGLLTGLGDEFPNLAAEIARATGNVELSFDAIMQDPARFGASIANLFNTMDQDSVAARRLRSVLEQMGPSFMFLVQGGERSQQALQAAMGDAGDVTNAFANMARGAGGSMRTFAESMELVEERFRAGLDRMAKRHYPNFERQVITRQREAFGQLSNKVNEFAGGDGVLNAALRSMIALRRGGSTGLALSLKKELGKAFPNLASKIGTVLPMLDGVGEGFFQVAGQIGPLMLGLSAMGVKLPQIGKLFSFATNPLILFGGGLYLLIRYWDDLGPLFEKGSVYFSEFALSVLEFANRIDWKKIGTDVVNGILGAFGALGDIGESQEMSSTAKAMAKGFQNLFSAVGRIVSGLARGMWDRAIEWIFEPVDIENQVKRAGAAIGVSVGAVFGAAMFTPLKSGLVRSIGRLFSGFGRMFSGSGGMLAGGALKTFLRRIPYIGAIIGVLFDLPEIISSFKTEGIVAGIGSVLESIVNGIFLGVPGMVGDAMGIDILGGIFDYLESMFNKWLGYVQPVFNEWMGVFREVGDIFIELWDDTLKPLFDEILSIDLGGIFGDASDGAKGLGGILSGIMDWLMPKLQEFSRALMPRVIFGFEVLATVIRGLIPVFKLLLKIGSVVFGALIDYVSFFANNITIPLFESIGNVAFSVFIGIQRFIERRINDVASALGFLGATWDASMNVFKASFRYIGASVMYYLVRPFTKIKDVFVELTEGASSAFLSLKLGVMETFHAILEAIEGLVDRVPVFRSLFGGALVGAREELGREIDALRGVVEGSDADAARRMAERREAARLAAEEFAGYRRDLEAATDAHEQATIAAVRAPATISRERGVGAMATPEAPIRAGVAIPVTGAVTPVGVAESIPPTTATPIAPTAEEARAGVRQAASRREGAVAAERTREARQIAREMMISGFSGQAKRDITEAMRQAMPRPSRAQGETARPSSVQSGQLY